MTSRWTCSTHAGLSRCHEIGPSIARFQATVSHEMLITTVGHNQPVSCRTKQTTAAKTSTALFPWTICFRTSIFPRTTDKTGNSPVQGNPFILPDNMNETPSSDNSHAPETFHLFTPVRIQPIFHSTLTDCQGTVFHTGHGN